MSSSKKNGASAPKRDFTKMKTPHTYAIIFAVILVCWILTFLIPAGKFSTHTIEYTDSDGDISTRTVLMSDTFRYYYNLDTDSVKVHLEELSQDAPLMEELGVDEAALDEFLTTDSSAWTQEDLDELGLTDDVLYAQYGESIYDTTQKLHKTAGVWGTEDFGGFGFLNYVFEGLVTGDRSGSAVGICALILVVGGAFGAHLRPAAAAAIGMFPEELAPKVRLVGNCAGAGACAALLSEDARVRMKAVAEAARYVELSLDQGFSDAYIDAMEFEGAIV